LGALGPKNPFWGGDKRGNFRKKKRGWGKGGGGKKKKKKKLGGDFPKPQPHYPEKGGLKTQREKRGFLFSHGRPSVYWGGKTKLNGGKIFFPIQGGKKKKKKKNPGVFFLNFFFCPLGPDPRFEGKKKIFFA